ncbi:MAG TPA: energy-coupling factor transporter ATPase, partial [Clostridiales bacterium]|nr:energy-coupling factor transporter ATPase [Clostridiales bacterium]
MEELIQFDHVSFSYEEEAEEKEAEQSPRDWAIQDVSLSVKKGEYVAILGHNGSGKSTLAKLCNGILLPDQGTVTSYGINTKEEDRLMELRQHVGMVFQNPDNQIVATIVEEDVAFGPENLGVPPEEIRERVTSCLNAVGMEKYRLHEPHKLSGGQKQRVAIAGILAMEPECIILDESTAMLDPRGRKEVMRTVSKMHEEMGLTVIFITHFMEEAATAERVIVMDEG